MRAQAYKDHYGHLVLGILEGTRIMGSWAGLVWAADRASCGPRRQVAPLAVGVIPSPLACWMHEPLGMKHQLHLASVLRIWG